MPTSNNSSGRDRLVAEAFHEGWSHGPLAAAARSAARHVRRRRRVRQVVAGVFVGLVILAGGRWATLRQDSELAQSEPINQPVAQRDTMVVPHCTYELITDEQLALALRNRKILLVRETGAYVEAVFLEH